MPRVILVLLLFGACAKDPAPAPPLHGWVVPGSITRDIVAGESLLTFTIEEQGKQIKASLVGPPPDYVKDNAEVTLRGTTRDGVLLVSEIRWVAPEY